MPTEFKKADDLARILPPLRLVRQRHLRRHERHAAGTSDAPRQRARRVLLDRAARRIRRRRVDLRRLQRSGIEPGLTVDRLQRHRIVRRNPVELRQRETARIVGELLFGPAAERNDPVARLRGTHALLQHFHDLLARRDAVEPHLRMPFFGHAHESAHGCRSSPGMTVLPLRSMVFVPASASFAMSCGLARRLRCARL
jgi:hypothetical protein